jgi:hypothetical protein
METRIKMKGVLLENYGRLMAGTEVPVDNSGYDWIRSGGLLIPMDLVSLPAWPGTLRAEYIERGFIRPKPVFVRRPNASRHREG